MNNQQTILPVEDPQLGGTSDRLGAQDRTLPKNSHRILRNAAEPGTWTGMAPHYSQDRPPTKAPEPVALDGRHQRRTWASSSGRMNDANLRIVASALTLLEHALDLVNERRAEPPDRSAVMGLLQQTRLYLKALCGQQLKLKDRL